MNENGPRFNERRGVQNIKTKGQRNYPDGSRSGRSETLDRFEEQEASLARCVSNPPPSIRLKDALSRGWRGEKKRVRDL